MRAQYHKYGRMVRDLIDKITQTEEENIVAGAQILADVIQNDQLIHVVGTDGHGFAAAEDLFYRGGGLVPINPLFEQGLTLTHGALRSARIQRLPGYMQPVLDYYQVTSGDALLVVNAAGVNAATIDAVEESKRRGARVIGVSSSAFAQSISADHPARHPSGRNMYEMSEVDVHVDSHVPSGDTTISFDGELPKGGPVATLLNSFVVNELVVVAIEVMLERNMTPPVWAPESGMKDVEANAEYESAYWERIKHL